VAFSTNVLDPVTLESTDFVLEVRSSSRRERQCAASGWAL